MISFRDPGFLFLLVLPVFLFLFRNRPSCRERVDFPVLERIPAGGGTLRLKTLWIPPLLRAVGLALVIFALARPAAVRTAIPIASRGIDLALLVDRSSSMGDPAPPRLSKRVPGKSAEAPPVGESDRGGGKESREKSVLDLLKEAAVPFVRARKGDRMAVVVFSRTPETVCPFTLDRDAVAKWIAGIEAVAEGTEEDGTAIGAALAEAARLFSSGRRAAGRAAVLFTDGRENRFSIEPLAAARLLAAVGVRVYPVAIDRGGGERPDAGLNSRIAAITGGSAFRVRGPGDLQGVLARLDRLEKRPLKERSFIVRADLFRRFLLPGVSCLFLAFLLAGTFYRRAP